MTQLLPDFPVDGETLDLLELALRPGPRCPDCAGTGQPVVPAPGEQCSGCNGRGTVGITLSGVLDVLSGYDPAKSVPMVDEYDMTVPGWFEYQGGAIYVTEDVLRALIAEVRLLRARLDVVSDSAGVDNKETS